MSVKQRRDFFKVSPKPGMPLSANGIAEGLSAMAYALERLNVQGGHVQWYDGVPTIVVGDGAGGLPACPAGAGTYYLRTVSDGAGHCTLAWVLAVAADCGGT